MVYSSELGYDPDEWEECPETEHFLALSLFTRICLGILTAFVAMLFFWILELNKRKGHKLEEQKTKVEPWRPLEDIGRDEEELSAETRLERASQEAEQKARPERRRNSKRELTKDDEMALLAWKAEVHRVEQERLRASEELIDSEIGESQQNPEFTFEDVNIENKELERQKEKKMAKEFTDIAPVINIPEENDEKNKKDRNARRQVQKIGEEKEKFESDPIAFSSIFAKSSEEIQTYDDDLLPANAPGTSQQIQEQLNKTQEMGASPLLLELPRPKDLTRLHAEFAPGATPPCTPPGGIPAENVPEVAAHYRQMADELTRKLLEELDEMGGAEGDAREMAAEFKNRHKGQIEGALEGSGASQEVCKEMERQLETHMETVVSQEMRRRSSAAILAKEVDENKKALEEHESKKGAGAKKGSSSSEEGFVKIRAKATDEDELGVPSGDLFVAASPSSPPILLVENRLTPSPQMATTDDEEMEQAGGIRVSLFSAGEGDGDGMSTTADDIEFVQSAGPSPMPPSAVEKINEEKGVEGASTTKVVEKKDRRELNADETEQVLALLQEYDLGESGGNAADEGRRRQFSSGAASSKVSSGGIISLPESAQPTPGSNSIPETPGSLGFDFINFPAGNGGGQQEIAMDKTSNESPKTMGMRRIEMVEQQLKAGDEWEEDAGTLNRPKLPPELPLPPTNEEAATLLQKEEMNAEVNKITRIEQREKVEAQFQLPSSGSSSQKEKDSKQQKAEKFLQEALDYMDQANTKGQKGGQELGEQQAAAMGAGEFVVEEEMLESEEGGEPGQKATKLTPVAGRKEKSSKKGGSTTGGADGTSKQIRTNEAFDKPDPMFLFDDADDRDVTYAPEIQSMEVPPDQLSQADSLNLVDENFSEHQEIPSASAEGKISPRKTAENEEIEQQKEVVVHEKRVVKEWKMETKGGDEGEGTKDYGMDDFEKEGGDGRHRGRELTPREEAELQREIDQLRRTPSPRYPDQPPKPKKPQAPQFLRSYFNNDESTSSGLDSTSMRQSSLLSAVGVSSTQEMLLKLTSLEALSEAMRKAGLESSNLIFGIDYTASNKYQGERSFGGRSLHSIADPNVENPYQQVIKIMGRTLAPFAGTEYGIPVFGFGDSSTGDWSVFAVNGTQEGECSDLEDVLRVYNRVTPSIDLSGPTNFAPLIYRSMEICHRRKDYHILVIIADGQVTNERATRKAIVSACQYPLSIIVVGVGDGPWDMMRVFDESLPKRPWDNFHFVEFHALITEKREELTMHQNPELAFAVHSLLEIPDQYNIIRKIGMLLPTYYTRPQPHSPRSNSPKPQFKK